MPSNKPQTETSKPAKGPFTQAIFVAQKLHQVSNTFETPAISREKKSPLVYARANSRRFHGDFIAAISQETSCNFGATKIALSCATKIVV